MAVEIRCHATLRDYLPDCAEKGIYQYELKDEKNVREVANSLDLPVEELHLIIVNGVQKDLDASIQDGDRIGLFPPVGGG